MTAPKGKKLLLSCQWSVLKQKLDITSRGEYIRLREIARRKFGKK